MTSPWAAGEQPSTDPASADTVTIVDGSTFCLSSATGEILPSRAHGLFVRDTRVVSRWDFRVDGAAPEPLTVEVAEPFAATFIGRVTGHAGPSESTLLVVRRRYVGEGMREDITVRNLSARAVAVDLSMTVGADFADLFEVKDGRFRDGGQQPGTPVAAALLFRGDRDRHEAGVGVHADPTPETAPDSMRWTARIPSRDEWTVSIEVVPTIDGQTLPPRHPRGLPVEHSVPARRLREWRSLGPTLSTPDAPLAAALRRGVEDLGALRIFDPAHPDRAAVAAGAPWFMALFGRDSLLSSWMLLPFDHRLALGTLQTLAEHQGVAVNANTEEEPGRILHETRFGPSTALALGGRQVYYGTADATPLFVMLLAELRRWGVPRADIEPLLPHADRALDWIRRHGDRDGDGFVEYQRATDEGLANQGWKDSWDGVNFADGAIARSPIALAEVQGYTYAAYLARAYLAADGGEPEVAAHWTAQAERLREAFDEAFWLPEQGWYAVGLDRDKRPIDALTSNIGHCLWTGIAKQERAASVAAHLMSPAMFTGWGIRTLSADMGAYNPMSYHNGSVWPHDNALCAAGLMRYGYTEEAQRVAMALIDAATYFDSRLPELFCGLDRREFPAPVPYPTSCSPQAWAAATPLQLLRTLLRFDPDVPAGQLWMDPALPARLLPLRMTGLRLRDREFTLEVLADEWSLAGDGGDATTVHRTPRPPHRT